MAVVTQTSGSGGWWGLALDNTTHPAAQETAAIDAGI
jgi:hypothetical protein